jgi:hypothetical protein
MDIATIIKQLKISERNVTHFVGRKNMYDKYRHLNFEIAIPIES